MRVTVKCQKARRADLYSQSVTTYFSLRVQMFWISAANTWCSKYRDKALEKRIKTGVHSPGMFRVQGPFSNSQVGLQLSIILSFLILHFQEFARDFQCKPGSRMNPVEKCEVW